MWRSCLDFAPRSCDTRHLSRPTSSCILSMRLSPRVSLSSHPPRASTPRWLAPPTSTRRPRSPLAIPSHCRHYRCDARSNPVKRSRTLYPRPQRTPVRSKVYACHHNRAFQIKIPTHPPRASSASPLHPSSRPHPSNTRARPRPSDGVRTPQIRCHYRRHRRRSRRR